MIPIYCFHHVVPLSIYKKIPTKDKYLYITTSNFEKRLQMLKNRGIKVLSTKEFVEIVKTKKEIKNSVFITFDDGNEDQYTYAYPLLKKYNMKAVFFLITSKIGNENFLKPEQLIEMRDLIDYQCHTHNLHHRGRIKSSSDEEKWDDLNQCLSILQTYNGDDQTKQYNLFCYPFGGTGKHFKSVVKSGLFDACFTCGKNRYIVNTHHKYFIPRVIISR